MAYTYKEADNNFSCFYNLIKDLKKSFELIENFKYKRYIDAIDVVEYINSEFILYSYSETDKYDFSIRRDVDGYETFYIKTKIFDDMPAASPDKLSTISINLSFQCSPNILDFDIKYDIKDYDYINMNDMLEELVTIFKAIADNINNNLRYCSEEEEE